MSVWCAETRTLVRLPELWLFISVMQMAQNLLPTTNFVENITKIEANSFSKVEIMFYSLISSGILFLVFHINLVLISHQEAFFLLSVLTAEKVRY